MKKILILSLITLVSLQAYEIKMNKLFKQDVMPDTLGVNISLQTHQTTSKDVLDKLSSYSDFINSFKELTIKGGDFNTYPDYRYHDSKREKVGYRGNINYQITSKDSSKIKNFISMLSAKNIDKDVDISISSSRWQVPEEKRENSLEELKFKALSWAKTYSEKLSTKLGQTCSLKSVDFNHSYYNRPPIVYAKAVSSDAKVPTPNKTATKLSINPNFVFECK